MSITQSLAPSIPVLLTFFGVLVFSLATAVIVLLADY